MEGFLYLWKKKILSDFLHQAEIKSLNSAKSLNNLIPDYISPFHTGLTLIRGIGDWLNKISTRIKTDLEISFTLH